MSHSLAKLEKENDACARMAAAQAAASDFGALCRLSLIHISWIVMALLSGFAIWLGSNLKLENVSKRQAAAEFIVERLDQFCLLYTSDGRPAGR